jgi:outer membrane protein TolC
MLGDEKAGMPELKLTMNTVPKIELGGRSSGTTMGSDIQIHGGQALLGGNLTADMKVSANLLDPDPVSSTVWVTFKRNLIGGDTKDVGKDGRNVLDDARDKLVSDVISAYVSVLKKQRQVELAECDLDIKRMAVTALQARNEEEAKIEVAEDQLQVAVKSYEVALSALSDALHMLKGYLGISGNIQLELCEGIIASDTSIGLEEWLDLAMTSNQTIVGAVDAVRRSRDKLKELQVGPGWNADLSAGLNPFELGSSSKPNFYVQVIASRILDLTPKLEIEEAKVALDAAELALLDAKDSVIKQVETTYRRLGETLRRLEDLRLQLDKAEEELDIAERKYEVGFISILDLLKVQYSVASTQNEMFSTNCDAVLTSFELSRLCGLSEY